MSKATSGKLNPSNGGFCYRSDARLAKPREELIVRSATQCRVVAIDCLRIARAEKLIL
jgi:hypothetical protein